MNSETQMKLGREISLRSARTMRAHCIALGKPIPGSVLELLVTAGEGTQGTGTTTFIVNEDPMSLARPDARRLECGYSTMQVFQCRAPIQTRFPASECRKEEE